MRLRNTLGFDLPNWRPLAATVADVVGVALTLQAWLAGPLALRFASLDLDSFGLASAIRAAYLDAEPRRPSPSG